MKRLFITIAAIVPVLFAGSVAVAQGGGAASHAVAASPSKLTLCHKVGSDQWRRMTVSSRAMSNPKSKSGKLLRGHLRHTGDAVVVGAAACPVVTLTPAPTSTPPARLTICHKTGSASNPYRRITVSSRAVTNPNSPAGKTLRGHMRHTGDIMLPGVNPCPTGTTQTQGVKLSANLQPVAGATGSGTASVTIRGATLCHTLTVTGLVNVTAAHIHRVSTSAIVVPLTTPTTGTSSGCGQIDRALAREIAQNPGAFYVNVHTMTFPNGQISGTLSK
ncbi:MAG TPA: CHRD domain-containing protein [Gaiellaceae bacterium]|nr:CHRD domain-containing protein [Gaiellaceae bacterium]